MKGVAVRVEWKRAVQVKRPQGAGEGAKRSGDTHPLPGISFEKPASLRPENRECSRLCGL